MQPTVTSSLLWGLIGVLAFLVLVQTHHLVTDEAVSAFLVGGVGTAVGVASALFAHVLRPRLRRFVHDRSIE